MPIREVPLEKRIGEYCKPRGWLYFKFGTGGWPDRLVILPGGRHIWVEFKTGTELSPLQRTRKQTLEKIGAETYVIRTLDAFKAITRTGRRSSLSSGTP